MQTSSLASGTTITMAQLLSIRKQFSAKTCMLSRLLLRKVEKRTQMTTRAPLLLTLSLKTLLNGYVQTSLKLRLTMILLLTCEQKWKIAMLTWVLTRKVSLVLQNSKVSIHYGCMFDLCLPFLSLSSIMRTRHYSYFTKTFLLWVIATRVCPSSLG